MHNHLIFCSQYISLRIYQIISRSHERKNIAPGETLLSLAQRKSRRFEPSFLSVIKLSCNHVPTCLPTLCLTRIPLPKPAEPCPRIPSHQSPFLTHQSFILWILSTQSSPRDPEQKKFVAHLLKSWSVLVTACVSSP